jgi:hypothetical protein
MRLSRLRDPPTSVTTELSIHFNMSTWNPYTVVLMESDYTVTMPF